ncbi:hypothetical protein OPV22_003483 [Ensete ventricosum]|uniref:YTH domain-containing family protein n=1 Tax=Ensete ventricosum TaxID=4639 RepID=A0AAV8S0Z0_ENSVE|nr:hypothetical protein OPV22_003483 [Ensete ventricosum]
MAAVSPAPPADQATDLMQKLSLNPTNKSDDSSDVSKKPSGVQYGSANGGELPIAPIPTCKRSLTPLLQEHVDASMCYFPNGYTSPFYYGGYDASITEWEDYPRYVSPDGMEVPPLGVYGDMYQHGYGYAPYTPYSAPANAVSSMTSHISNTTSTRNQNLHPVPHLAGMHAPRPAAPGIVNKIEDDIHKSIKYNVWASTPHGNKKLDAAYQESKEKTSGCPVFLFFSVNTSGQFVGVAEMHVTLENNENKPVTNSRDTQEVKLEQGLQLLKLFKEHVGKTSILDDFSFYETRQKVMQEKRTKQQQLQKKVVDGKPVDFDGKDNNEANGKPSEAITLLKKETARDGLAVETNGVAGVCSKEC